MKEKLVSLMGRSPQKPAGYTGEFFVSNFWPPPLCRLHQGDVTTSFLMVDFTGEAHFPSVGYTGDM